MNCEKQTVCNVHDMYEIFCKATIKDIENALLITKDSEQRAFYRKILNLKLQMEQEKVVGERLV